MSPVVLAFVSKVYYRTHRGWVRREIFEIKVSQNAGNPYFDITFLVNTVGSTFFNYTFFHLLYKQHVA